MRSATFLLSALLVTSFALAIVPAAEAREICSDLVDSGCRSAVCLNSRTCSEDLNWDCVTEPCPQPIP